MLFFMDVEHEFIEVDPVLLLELQGLIEYVHQESLPAAFTIHNYNKIFNTWTPIAVEPKQFP